MGGAHSLAASVRAVTPGNSLPSSSSRLAPPPVLTWLTLSSHTKLLSTSSSVTTTCMKDTTQAQKNDAVEEKFGRSKHESGIDLHN